MSSAHHKFFVALTNSRFKFISQRRICKFFPPVGTIGLCIILYFYVIFSKSKESCVSLHLDGPPKQDDPKLIKYIQNNLIDGPSERPYNLSSNPYYKASKHGLSWPVVYNTLVTLFSKTKGGFFIEAGALDGEFLSNTLWLERKLGWSGLLVEPNPDSYRALLWKNRKVWSSNGCLSSKPYPYKSTFVGFFKNKNHELKYNPWVYRGSSHMLGQTMPPAYEGIVAGSFKSYYQVQCLPLFSYILAMNRTDIDLLILDVQGSEEDVINTIPFDRVKIKVLVVEHSGSGNVLDLNFKKFFEEKGLRLINCFGEPDYFFVLENEFRHLSFPSVVNCNRSHF